MRSRGTSTSDEETRNVADRMTWNWQGKGIRHEPGAEGEYIRGFCDGAAEKW